MRSDARSSLTGENRLAIFGAGGSAREVAWLAQQCWGEDVKLTFVIDREAPPPGVHLAGWVNLGRRVFLGTGAVVKNGAPGHPIVIGDDAIIGAGACVIADIERNAKLAGVPARPI